MNLQAYAYINELAMMIKNPNPDELNFLDQIKKELSLTNVKQVVPFVASVLHALRQTMTLQNANLLLNRLPDFLKIVFACDWETSEEQRPVKHLDELVNLVMERDRKNQKFLFKSEEQTLSIIILTLKKIYRLTDLGNFEGISHPFRQELEEASVEVAAA